MEIDLLKEIAENTSHKNSFQIIVSNNKSNFKTNFNPPIELDKNRKYEIALVNLETYNSVPNVSNENNVFKYSHNNGRNWNTLTLNEGCYELKDINNEIERQMQSNNHWDRANEESYIKLIANTATLKSNIDISENYKVDFRVNNSIRSVLGFDSEILSAGFHESKDIVNINNISSIFIDIDIISGSYVNGHLQPTIFSFFPDVAPGFKIVEHPKNLVYLPIILDTINSLNVSITDQNNKILNFRGETITIRFHIREI